MKEHWIINHNSKVSSQVLIFEGNSWLLWASNSSPGWSSQSLHVLEFYRPYMMKSLIIWDFCGNILWWERANVQTQILISGILLKQSCMQRGALGPVANPQVSPYCGPSTPTAGTMLHPHGVQNDSKWVCKAPSQRSGTTLTTWEHFVALPWHKETHAFTCNIGNQDKEGTRFFTNPKIHDLKHYITKIVF